MQLKPSPSMAQQLSAILADIAAPATHHQARSGLVTILHALILSALDRLIRCLETAFALWQAGQLPALAPRATAHTTAAPATTAPRHNRPLPAGITPRRHRAINRLQSARQYPASPNRGVHRQPRRRSPPSCHLREKTAAGIALPHIYIITISKHTHKSAYFPGGTNNMNRANGRRNSSK